MSLLTIAIPTYNRDNILDKNLNNLCNQIVASGYENEINIVIFDNFSNDNTEYVCFKYQKNKFFKYTKNPSNIGAEANFYNCIQQSSGTYTWILGDDDYLTENAISTILPNLKKGYKTVIMNSSGFVNDETILLYPQYLPIENDLYLEKLKDAIDIPGFGHSISWISGIIFDTLTLQKSSWKNFLEKKPGYEHTYVLFEKFFMASTMIISAPLIRNRYGAWRDDTGNFSGGALGQFHIYLGNLEIIANLINDEIISTKELNKITIRDQDFELKPFLFGLIENSLKLSIIRSNGISIDYYNQAIQYDYLFENKDLKNKQQALLRTALSIEFLKNSITLL